MTNRPEKFGCIIRVRVRYIIVYKNTTNNKAQSEDSEGRQHN